MRHRILRAFIGTSAILLITIGLIALIKGPSYLFLSYYSWNGYNKHQASDTKGAIDAYTIALSYDSSDAVTYINRGSAYSEQKQYQKAISDYNKASNLTPDDPLIYAYRGRNYYDLKEFDKAMADLDKAISLDSLCAYAYYNRGLMQYTVWHNREKGCLDFKKALDLGFEEVRGFINKNAKCESVWGQQI